ncbi:cytochrome c biogenesis protein CcsA [Sulfurimonas sp. HSL-1716]|uniref:cytochrome c biogenesis protein CcsA n=1 Tax=Hydrocurvibacter sulfurireducens TaxID=3131937 RepID=UPI0031F726C1
MKKILSFMGSMKTAAVLMLIFAFSIGYATIVENDFGTMTAKADIYNARWFEILLGLLAVNLFLNIINFKMYARKKTLIFVFHVAFFVILLGAAVTRYMGFEGMMHIREGQTSSVMTSSEPYLNVKATDGTNTVESFKKLYLSKNASNSYNQNIKIGAKEMHVKLAEYIPDAVIQLVEDKNGKPTASMMVTLNGRGQSVQLSQGEFFETGDLVLDFGSGKKFDKPVIEIFVDNKKIYINHQMDLTYLKMDDKSGGTLKANSKEELVTRILHSYNNTNFVLREFYPSAVKKIVRNPNAKARNPGIDALRFEVGDAKEKKTVLVYGRSGDIGDDSSVLVDGVKLSINYGAKIINLPFGIKLNDFQLERYPGSMSPASYASEVTLIDKEQNLQEPYRIYMNHILDHRGYRFFQSSYDQDEKGTILSVNNDPGTIITYIGYLMLAVGMFGSLFMSNGRFAKLSKKAKEISASRTVAALLALAAVFTYSNSYAEELNPIIKTIKSFDKGHADKFSRIVVQDSSGRMKPFDTLATEILNKIHRGNSILGLDANQVILGMMIRPDAWREIKMINTSNKEINKILGIPKSERYASFSQFFQAPNDLQGYKLEKYADEAIRKAPNNRDNFDKAVLAVDERVNVAYMVYSGAIVKIWPKPNDINHKWFATVDALQTFDKTISLNIRNIAIDYFSNVDKALKTGDWTKADKALTRIEKYQRFYGAAVYPEDKKISLEIAYNHSYVFEKLWPLYFLVGFVLLALSFVKILRPSFKIDIYSKSAMFLLIAFFIAHTMGLAVRWYISGHAPWSNGFESMVYIAWATVLAGFIFSKHSPITLASTSILAGLILFVAHLNWMDPKVTNLVPVLQSYWLSIHVSMITASYGFLGLGALLGFITIILFVVKNKHNDKRISSSIIELNAINEMSLLIGLAMLTTGNFLGGVWANESWGRYWGWDPKETWALVTILVYAVVVHLRFIKSLYTPFNYSVISLLAFTSVIMTYFGVNYYLAGMHSYAKGDPVPIPGFVPVTYIIIFALIALAFKNRKLAVK